MGFTLHTAAERPDLWERGIPSASVWPEYNLHGDVLNRWWPLPRSLQIIGTVGDWEAWTGMAFPDSGDYVFPEGLAPVHIDRSTDRGSYWEPNVWMVHPDLTPNARKHVPGPTEA